MVFAQAGEDLEEIEEEEFVDDEESRVQTPEYLEGASDYGIGETPPLLTEAPIPSSDGHKATERSPLLQRPHNRRTRSKSQRRRMSSLGPHGDASVTDAVLMVRIQQILRVANAHHRCSC